MRPTVIAVLTLALTSSSLWAVIDIFVEITPRLTAESPLHLPKVKLEEQKSGNHLLTLTRLKGLEAWLVVCEKARGESSRNFRYDINWTTSTARKKGIDLVVPIAFTKEGTGSLQLTDDLATRSYIVYGGQFDDGTFYTVNVPAFRKNLVESDVDETKKAWIELNRKSIERAECIAIVDLEQIEKSEVDLYLDKTDAVVLRSLKGNLEGKVKFYGGNGMIDFIHMGSGFKKGKSLVMLSRDKAGRLKSDSFGSVLNEKVHWKTGGWANNGAPVDLKFVEQEIQNFLEKQ